MTFRLSYPERVPDQRQLSLVVDELAAALKDAGSPDRAVHEKAYLKSNREHFGTSVPAMVKITRRLLADPALGGLDDRSTVLALVSEAWERGPHELRMAAVEVLTARMNLLEQDDIDLIERLVRDSGTWALIDGIAPSVVWSLLARYPALEARIDAWAVDPDFWLRRAALLAYLLPMRRGEAVFERFTSLADPMLEEREFFIRKAIGWVLRERTKLRPDEVFEWLLPRARRASPLTLRQAGKHLGEERLTALLRAHSG